MHEPVYLAHRVAMLDHLARGRFNWGIGLGGIPTDMTPEGRGDFFPKVNYG